MASRDQAVVIRRAVPRLRTLVLTIGHSTRTQADFIALLKTHDVKRLVDVRTIPRSRHNPQFNRDRLGPALRKAGIAYLHLKALGGLRHARPDSMNGAWRNASFRGFADYMQTREFAHGLRRLMKLARSKQAAIMCAEAVPWRCHRSLIADALLAHGYRVEEIESLKRTRPHALHPWACVQGVKVTYPEKTAIRFARAKSKGGESSMIRLKRAYEPAGSTDGTRLLVERLWPRGVRKAALSIDAWLKDVAPSTSLRQWFSHDPKKWDEFQQRYRRELDANQEALRPILSAAGKGDVTLVYSSHDAAHNNAVALKEYVAEKLATKASSIHKSAASTQR